VRMITVGFVADRKHLRQFLHPPEGPFTISGMETPMINYPVCEGDHLISLPLVYTASLFGIPDGCCSTLSSSSPRFSAASKGGRPTRSAPSTPMRQFPKLGIPATVAFAGNCPCWSPPAAPAELSHRLFGFAV